MRITSQIRGELADHFVMKVANAKLNEEERDKLFEKISNKISDIVDEIFDLECDIDCDISELSGDVYTEEQRARDMENFVLKYQL